MSLIRGFHQVILPYLLTGLLLVETIHQRSHPTPPPGVNDIQMVRFSPSISPYHWNWFSAFCWFLQSKTFHGCQGESFLLKVNGFNWIFPKQKTDNGRNFVPISWLNMKVFWDTPQYTDILIAAKDQTVRPCLELGCFAQFDRQWKVCWSADPEIWTWIGVFTRCEVLTGIVRMRLVFLSLSPSC